MRRRDCLNGIIGSVRCAKQGYGANGAILIEKRKRVVIIALGMGIIALGGGAGDARDGLFHEHVEKLHGMNPDIGEHASALGGIVMPALDRVLQKELHGMVNRHMTAHNRFAGFGNVVCHLDVGGRKPQGA